MAMATQETQALIRDSFILFLKGKVRVFTPAELDMMRSIHYINIEHIVEAVNSYRWNSGMIKIGYKEYHNLNMLITLCNGVYGIILRDLNDRYEYLSWLGKARAKYRLSK